MRAVIQRVEKCKLEVESQLISSIDFGLLVLLGIEEADSAEDIEWLSGKISKLRIFDDSEGIMNLSVADANGKIMIVSQFTLFAGTRKGNRPSYIKAAVPDIAIPLYNAFVDQMGKDLGQKPATGVFGAHMKIQFTNDGPVTIIIDSKNRE
jgi:D-aminoacyl-tRNA deacylase